ncbi:MAG: ABC transporter permease [Acidobacteria bacterium]|nr:ABC transporter permease [Acidobacteriota bacterium]
MLELVFANLKVRPFRTLISIIGVALGVVLVVLFTGLARGMTNDMAKRASNWKAEIVFTRVGAMELTTSNASVSTTYAQKLMEIEGVGATVPVIRYITPNTKGRWGILQLDGVDWEPFAAMNEMKIIGGRAPTAANEIVVDERQLREDNRQIGDTMELFGDRQYTVVGIFAPPSGSRIKMSLGAMQEALEAPNKCTYILVKLKDGADVDAVASRINERLPGNKINLTRDLVIDAQERIPALNTFLRALVGLGAFVSTIFVLLSMYKKTTERRRGIGILKSLGASSSFIIRVIEGEAFLIGLFGVIGGFAVSFIASYLIESGFELQFEFSRGWILTAALIAIGGSLFGALYPAWKASTIDPVEVMVNE